MYALSDSKDMGKSCKRIRYEIVSIAFKYRYKKFNGKTLDLWVCATSKMDFAAWAHEFATNDAMSDQIVLFLWPLYKDEAVWMWQSSQGGGYKHSHICRFGTPKQKVRHVVYCKDKLHYTALRVIESAIPERALTSIPEHALTASKQVARAYHLQEHTHKYEYHSRVLQPLYTQAKFHQQDGSRTYFKPFILPRTQFMFCVAFAVRRGAFISLQAARETSEPVDARPQVYTFLRPQHLPHLAAL